MTNLISIGDFLVTVLLAQLSDIHFETRADLVLERAEQVGAAIAAEVQNGVSKIILLICGDVSYSGLPDEFQIATEFFKSIEGTIAARHPALPISRLVIPGNHDCNFGKDQAAREALLPDVDSLVLPPSSIREIILEPLDQYFRFASEYSGDSTAITAENPFYKCVDIQDRDKCLRLHLVNTAWMSSKHEVTGSLHFPLVAIDPPSSRSDAALAVLHHPIHWLKQPHAMRPLRDRLSELASVMIVNHEHTPEATSQDQRHGVDPTSLKTLLIAGGALQENPKSLTSIFNILKVDLVAGLLDLTTHHFRNTPPAPYFERVEVIQFDLKGLRPHLSGSGLILSDSMTQFLEDPGAPVTHPRRDPRIPIHLPEIFIFPDLWELDDDHEGSSQKQIRSSNVVEEIEKSAQVLLTGGEKSGRTSISKTLFQQMFQKGKVPLFLNGRDLPKKPDRLRDVVRRAVKDQYANLTPDAFEQLPPSSKVVLIDDIHLFATTSEVRKAVLQQLERDFAQVIVSGDNLLQLDQLSGSDGRDSGLWEYRHLVILGFGEYLREQFVRKWLELSGDTIPADNELRIEVQRLCGILNVVIQKQLLPSYPLFMIVVLQQCGISGVDSQNSSFGHLFQGVITAILSKTRFTKITIGDKYHYLASLAKMLFDRQTISVSSEEMRGWHDRYWDNIDVKVDFVKLTEDLKDLGVLSLGHDSVQFRYSYFYCFFMAYHLNHGVHRPETRQLISKLCKQLHHRFSADIVLFLAHLSSDPIIMDEMTNTCDALLRGSPTVTFVDDVTPLNKLSQTAQTLSIPDQPDENRRKLKLRNDETVKERLVANSAAQDMIAPEAETELMRRLFELHAAYKSIQILGQALRNIGGSAPRAIKEEVLSKIVALAKRLIGSYLALLKQKDISELLQKIAELHQLQQPEVQRAEIYEDVCKHLYGMSQFVCFSIIRHTTFSVGSENLTSTIDRFLKGVDGVPEKIFALSFALEHDKRFPKDAALKLHGSLARNPFPADVVRMLVAHHLYMFSVPFSDRQAVCQKMSIDVQPNVLDPKRKLLT